MKKFLDFLRFVPSILLRVAHVIKHIFCEVDCNEK